MLFKNVFLLAVALATASHASATDSPPVDPALPAYQPKGSLKGELRSVGADVMDVITLGWLELFRAAHPRVVASMEARAPGTTIPSLVSGLGQLGPVARELFPHEIQQFAEKFGYPPTRIRVATASLAHIGTAQTIVLYVNDDNPLASITLDQVRDIYSKNGSITKWGQLGLTGDWAERPIELWGVRRINGVANYIQERCLGGREFRSGINERFNQDEMHALDAITTGIASSHYSLGYSGLSSTRSGVKALALAEHNGEPAVQPTIENVASHRYPLSRFVYIFINRAPGKPVDPNVLEFLRLVLSRDGQEVVARQGLYIPLTAAMAREELAKLE